MPLLTTTMKHLINIAKRMDNHINASDQLLRRDVRKSEVAVLRQIKVTLEDGQFDALCSFVFNLGSGSLQSSTLKRKINRGDYIGASDEFPRWVYAGGRKLKGLIKRRNHERLMFIGG